MRSNPAGILSRPALNSQFLASASPKPKKALTRRPASAKRRVQSPNPLMPRLTDGQIDLLLQTSPKKGEMKKFKIQMMNFMQKMEQHGAAPELNTSAKEIGLYRAAIE